MSIFINHSLVLLLKILTWLPSMCSLWRGIALVSLGQETLKFQLIIVTFGGQRKSRFVLLEVIHDSPCQIEKQYETVLDSLLPNLSLTSPIMFSF
jgi:hypothetical protein